MLIDDPRYRELVPGEVVQEGDEYLINDYLYMYLGWQPILENHIGRIVESFRPIALNFVFRRLING